uniref:RNA-directed DNA polymerase n=2 Tax=Cacopsylla melanoneura TaxID=428564 RepID=A0A8D8X673_9HEMI
MFSVPRLSLCSTKENENRETVLTCDASMKGLGAVLQQRQDDGTLKPVYFCSRTLNKSEHNYANIEREALAVTWSCSRLEDFIIGKCITIETDHKPLVQLLQTSQLTDLTPRIQRFRLRLMKYSYKIVYVPGKHIVVADYLSRHPIVGLDNSTDELAEETMAYVQEVINNIPTTDENVMNAMNAQAKDDIIKEICKKIETQWERPKTNDPLLPFFHVKDELSVCNGMLMRGSRIVVPSSLRNDMLHRIHMGHLGITKSRLRARCALWWPGMSTDIEQFIKKCPICIQHQNNPNEPLITSELPDRPWQKVCSDLFKLDNKWFLVVSDLYSRYFELCPMSTLTSSEVINKMKSIFGRHGIPEMIYTDNGAQFHSSFTSEFQKFAREYGFSHRTSSPYHHQSNGAAEAAVKIAKVILKKNEDPFLASLVYRNTTIPELGKSPAELMFGRKLRDVLPMISANLKSSDYDDNCFRRRDSCYKENYKRNYDKRHRTRPLRELCEGETVWVTDLQTEAKVVKKINVRSYEIQTNDGQYRRNRKFLNPYLVYSKKVVKPAMQSNSNNYLWLPTQNDIVQHNNTNTQQGDTNISQANPNVQVSCEPTQVNVRRSLSDPNIQVSSHCFQSPVQDCFQSPVQASSPTTRSRSCESQDNSNQVRTKSGRVVKPPDRWGYT